MQWDYKSLHFDKRNFFSSRLDLQSLDKKLDRLGEEGWELVGFVPRGWAGWAEVTVVFKRPRAL